MNTAVTLGTLYGIYKWSNLILRGFFSFGLASNRFLTWSSALTLHTSRNGFSLVYFLISKSLQDQRCL